MGRLLLDCRSEVPRFLLYDCKEWRLEGQCSFVALHRLPDVTATFARLWSEGRHKCCLVPIRVNETGRCVVEIYLCGADLYVLRLHQDAQIRDCRCS